MVNIFYMIIAFDKALNLHRPSNTSSRVARVFECNSAEKTMSHHVQKSLYVDSPDYILNDSQNMMLHRHCTVITLIHGHCTVTTLMHGHWTGITRQCTVTTWMHAHHTGHGTHAHHTANTHITRHLSEKCMVTAQYCIQY